MKIINYIQVPSSSQTDDNYTHTSWVDGRCVLLDEGAFVTVFIGHHQRDFISKIDDKHSEKTTETVAMPIRVRKPITRDKLINAAEMTAYGLTNSIEIASFAASLDRKFRINAQDLDVKEHDEFILWVKSELDKNGFVKPGVTDLDRAKSIKKAEIQHYNTSSHVDCFILNGKSMWLPLETRISLTNSIAKEKALGRSETILWYDGVKYELPIPIAEKMLADLEMYALECYNTTQEHLVNVEKLGAVEDVMKYNYKTGYPEILNLSQKYN